MEISEVNRLSYKVSKTKSLKNNKIDKPLAKIYHIKKENTQIINIRNEKGDITTDYTNIERE